MEAALSKLCRQQNYDETLLNEIFTAYCLLDKCDDFFEMFGLSVVNAVNVSAAETLIGVGVHSFVLSQRLTSKTKENQAKVNAYVDELKRREFAQLFDVTFSFFVVFVLKLIFFQTCVCIVYIAYLNQPIQVSSSQHVHELVANHEELLSNEHFHLRELPK